MPVAESLGLAALGWVVSPVVKDLVDKSITYLGSDVAEDLKDLETTLLPELQRTIQTAHNNINSPREAATLKKWLARLKAAYYKADNILHMLEYKRLKRKAQGKDNKLWLRISSSPIIKPLAKFFTKKFLLFKLRHRLNKLMKIAVDAKKLRELIAQTRNPDVSKSDNGPLITTSLLPDKVFGRDTDRDNIIEFLLHAEGPSVVAITGIGGHGKTMLAQYVYNNEKVTNHFDVKMWVCLSRKLDVHGNTKHMIESASNKECPNISNFDTLQRSLLDILAPFERILLVLDDVWHDSKEGDQQWDELLKPFASEGCRCKILFTSRLQHFPAALQPGKHIKLTDMPDNSFLSLFRYYAFLGMENIDKRLSEIGDRIAKKMSKSPLAAKVIGNQLSKNPDIYFWQDTLKEVNLSSTRKVLLWSYHLLDAALQRCFLFCSIFSKGFKKRKMSLVQTWVALDFIQPTDDKNRSVEDIGIEYFNEMVANSIFQRGVDGRYTMHDLFHDLAENLSAGDCFKVTDSEKVIPEDTVVHLYLRCSSENLEENLSAMSNLRNLRTLILEGRPSSIEDASEMFSIIARSFKQLRVLRMSLRGWKTLPSVVGDMRNLRYLNISQSSIEKLPDPISDLYHLQFLKIPVSVKHLPTKMSNLINLRGILLYTIGGKAQYTLPPVPHLGKLTLLQHLPEFHVKKEEGHEVGQLGRLREIGGKLRIVGLENVRNRDEAIEAKLIEKPKLTELALVWGESAERGSEVDVIEALRPEENLQILEIDGYKGSSYPTWLQDSSHLQNIKDVRFSNCNALSSLPPNFNQFNYCSTLVLFKLEALTKLYSFPQTLAVLRITKCPSLILACENQLQVDAKHLGIIMQRALPKKMRVSNKYLKGLLSHEAKSFEKTGSLEKCPEQLQIIKNAHLQVDDALELHPSNLYELITCLTKEVNSAWWSCHEQRMNFILSRYSRANKLKLPLGLRILELRCCSIFDGELSACLGGMAALEVLILGGIMTITTLPPPQVLESLKKLHVLKIRNCWCLRSLGGLHALPQLQEFEVRHCSLVETVGARFPPSLQSFCIKECSLDGNIFSNLPYLKSVYILDCNVSSSLSFGQLTSLKKLHMSHCDNLSFVQVSEERLFIDVLNIRNPSNLDVESLVQCCRGCRQLQLSSSVVLNKLLSSQEFLPPTTLWMLGWEEPITFEKSDHLASIKTLGFAHSKKKNLSTSLTDFSALKSIIFLDLPEISELPELPDSVQHIRIRDSPVLKEKCKPNGPEWHKIQRIETRDIE